MAREVAQLTSPWTVGGGREGVRPGRRSGCPALGDLLFWVLSVALTKHPGLKQLRGGRVLMIPGHSLSFCGRQGRKELKQLTTSYHGQEQREEIVPLLSAYPISFPLPTCLEPE